MLRIMLLKKVSCFRQVVNVCVQFENHDNKPQ